MSLQRHNEGYARFDYDVPISTVLQQNCTPEDPLKVCICQQVRQLAPEIGDSPKCTPPSLITTTISITTLHRTDHEPDIALIRPIAGIDSA